MPGARHTLIPARRFSTLTVPEDLTALSSQLRDFLTVYEAHFETTNATLIDAASRLPGLGRFFHASFRHETERRLRASHKVVRRAILDCQWEPLLEVRRAQGRLYASLGVSLDELIEVFAMFKHLLVPHLVNSFSGDSARLVSALQATDRYVWIGLSAVVEGYSDLNPVQAALARAAALNGAGLH